MERFLKDLRTCYGEAGKIAADIIEKDRVVLKALAIEELVEGTLLIKAAKERLRDVPTDETSPIMNEYDPFHTNTTARRRNRR